MGCSQSLDILGVECRHNSGIRAQARPRTGVVRRVAGWSGRALGLRLHSRQFARTDRPLQHADGVGITRVRKRISMAESADDKTRCMDLGPETRHARHRVARRIVSAAATWLASTAVHGRAFVSVVGAAHPYLSYL